MPGINIKDTVEGRLFARLALELHNRRTGRTTGKPWSRDGLKPTRSRPPLDVLDDYRAGDPPLREDIHKDWKPHVRRFIRMGRLNMADLLISSTSSRLQLRDFRTAAANDEFGDQRARAIMRANDWKVKARDLNDTVLTLGDGYGIVTPAKDGGIPTFTDEDPRQVITAHDPATGAYLAGLKLFRSEWDDEDLAYLFLPGKIRRARRKGRSSITLGPHHLDPTKWEWDEQRDQKVPGDAIPIIHWRNRYGIGEYEHHLDTLDRINDKIFDEWWTAKIQAFRQRAVKNLPEEDEDGEPLPEGYYDDMFTASPDEMWQVPADVEFWESTPVDLTPITNAIEKDRSRLASSTSTPLHTINPDAANGSAEGASTMKEEHTFKCEDRQDRLDGGWARAMSLCFLFMGDTERADVAQIEPQWAPIERYSLQQRTDGASKVRGILPDEVIWRDVLQYAPAEVPEIRKLRSRQLLFQAPGQPAPQGGGTTAPSAPSAPAAE